VKFKGDDRVVTIARNTEPVTAESDSEADEPTGVDEGAEE